MKLTFEKGQEIIKQETVPSGQVLLISDCFSGVGIETDSGCYGVSVRDGGIEIMLKGELLYSHAIVFGKEQFTSWKDLKPENCEDSDPA